MGELCLGCSRRWNARLSIWRGQVLGLLGKVRGNRNFYWEDTVFSTVALGRCRRPWPVRLVESNRQTALRVTRLV